MPEAENKERDNAHEVYRFVHQLLTDGRTVGHVKTTDHRRTDKTCNKVTIVIASGLTIIIDTSNSRLALVAALGRHIQHKPCSFFHTVCLAVWYEIQLH